MRTCAADASASGATPRKVSAPKCSGDAAPHLGVVALVPTAVQLAAQRADVDAEHLRGARAIPLREGEGLLDDSSLDLIRFRRGHSEAMPPWPVVGPVGVT